MANIKTTESISTGSNYNFKQQIERANNPRNNFNLSHKVTTTIENAGVVFPISVIETIPTDEFEITVNSLTRVLPQVVPLYSEQRLYIYAFYSRCSDLWENFNTFMTKGYLGDENLKIPTLTKQNVETFNIQNQSWADYMGIPTTINTLDSNVVEKLEINAMPFMMYIRIWRDYFLNKDTIINNNKYKKILPNNDEEFRLDDDGNIKSFGNNPTKFCIESNIKTTNTITYSIDQLTDNETNQIRLGLFYHNWADDYFTTAKPFTQRGPEINIESEVKFKDDGQDNFIVPINLYDGTLKRGPAEINKLDNTVTLSLAQTTETESENFFGLPVYAPISNSNFTKLGISKNYILGKQETTWDRMGFNKNEIGELKVKINLSDIRNLIISQTELEKMANTDGTYSQFGLTFFGISPKNATNHKPIYIGGTVTNLQFSEVIQTSNTSEQKTPLGTYAGHGIGANTNGYIGKCYCDDYGYIMILGCYMPDTYYTDGIDKMYTRSLQSDMFLPDRARVEKQPILQKELQIQSNTQDNNSLFAYQNIYDELRYIKNKVTGLIADTKNLNYYPYTQARKLDKKEQWGYNFNTANDIRKDYLASKNDPAYTVQFGIDINAQRPIPYRSIPAQLLN